MIKKKLVRVTKLVKKVKEFMNRDIASVYSQLELQIT